MRVRQEGNGHHTERGNRTGCIKTTELDAEDQHRNQLAAQSFEESEQSNDGGQTECSDCMNISRIK